MYDIPCIIFAGGKSSRMGEDKSLLPFASAPSLTEYQLHKLQKIFTNVYISCKDKKKFDFNANFIEDISLDETYAPTAGFISIFEKLHTESFFVLSVDSPFVSSKEIELLLQKDNNTVDATIATTDSGMQPICGIYHRSLENRLQRMYKEGNHKLGYLLKSSQTQFIHFKDESPFLNINHPHEYQKALTLIAKSRQT